MHRHLLDKDNFLGGHVVLLEDPFQMPHASQRLRDL